MRLHRLHVRDFASVRDATIDFGPGLNVLYGPNDLGKSTLVDAIRLVLLLPHGSTHVGPYVPWTGATTPVVELTFETEPQRIWRVRKDFGKSGSSHLEVSKNGRDFEDAERGRKVDGKLREILGWGIPEPGGSATSKGLPQSFLATALLSTQADVTAMLRETLSGDVGESGKEQIAAALQAVAQDPLFVALLRSTQARRDEAYTEKGTKKTAKGSVLKIAAERVNRARDEMEELQRVVSDSEGAETQLRELIDRRTLRHASLASARERAGNIATLAQQSADIAIAAEEVRVAHDEVLRIKNIETAIASATERIDLLATQKARAETILKEAQSRESASQIGLKAAEDKVREEQSNPGVGDTVLRQQHELRKVTAEQAIATAERQLEDLDSAKRLVDAAVLSQSELVKQEQVAEAARASSSEANVSEQTLENELRRCDQLERIVEARIADKHLADCEAAVAKASDIQKRLTNLEDELVQMEQARGAVQVPAPPDLQVMRKLATEMATARGALAVGVVVSVSPRTSFGMEVRKDQDEAESISVTEPVDVEAISAIEIEIRDVATFSIKVGRRDAQASFLALERRWTQDAVPHLNAANVESLEALDVKLEEVRALDGRIRDHLAVIDALRSQLLPYADATTSLNVASARAELCRAALGTNATDSSVDLAPLGTDPVAALKERRLRALKGLDSARRRSGEALTALTLAAERATVLQLAQKTADGARDAALHPVPEGLSVALAAAKAILAAAVAERASATADLASLDSAFETRKIQTDAALASARAEVDATRLLVETARKHLEIALTDHASEVGRLGELRRLRSVEDLGAAEAQHGVKAQRLSSLPRPQETVTSDDVASAEVSAAGAARDLEAVEREIQRAHGALEQVGGSVARERLRDAIDAFELAQREEQETEAEYEAWLLLLDQMKAADAAQASNLGQAVVPALAEGFRALTQRRYETIQLTADLGTDGVVASGALRSIDRLSVGTREQLSTLYRLALAQYLQTTIVLDDQLVQSDDGRMEWFRQVLSENARAFQVVVFTCRPGDYLGDTPSLPAAGAVYSDCDDGFTRAIDLVGALGRA